MFGRGGEESQSLAKAGIPFRIVPGISSGIGGLAYAGIPVTHRDTNQVVTFLTGHDQNGLVPDAIDWEAVAKGSPVIVMYMAMKHMDTITASLIKAGRGADEPLAFVCNAATKDQKVLVSTIGTAAKDVETAGIEPPAIVVVGDVVRLRQGLDWLSALDGVQLEADPLGIRRMQDAG